MSDRKCGTMVDGLHNFKCTTTAAHYIQTGITTHILTSASLSTSYLEQFTTATSLLHLLCLSSGHVSRVTFYYFLSQSLTMYSGCAVTPVILDTNNIT